MTHPMSAWTKLCRGLVLMLGFFLALPAGAAPVATVSRIAGTAELLAVPPLALGEGSGIGMGDTILTQGGARVELRFIDGMVLTLGENARMVIDTLVYDPAATEAQASLRVSQGAFRVITGGIAKQPDHPFRLITPYASIGVRGTDFWGGALDDDPFAMVALDGAVVITTPKGTTLLTKGQGIEIKALGDGATTPHPWGRDKTDRAVGTVTFPDR